MKKLGGNPERIYVSSSESGANTLSIPSILFGFHVASKQRLEFQCIVNYSWHRFY